MLSKPNRIILGLPRTPFEISCRPLPGGELCWGVRPLLRHRQEAQGRVGEGEDGDGRYGAGRGIH
jgi:hypothetical protein